MVEIRFDKKFTNIFSKIKDELFRTKIMKQVKKISENPEIGKPMRNVRKQKAKLLITSSKRGQSKGTRELYIKPFRLSYSYLVKENIIYILDLYHKKKQ